MTDHRKLSLFVASETKEFKSQREYIELLCKDTEMFNAELFPGTAPGANLEPGDRLNAIAECDAFLCLIGSTPSTETIREIKLALKKGKTITTCYMPSRDLKLDYHKKVNALTIDKFQYIEAETLEKLKSKLLETLANILVHKFHQPNTLIEHTANPDKCYSFMKDIVQSANSSLYLLQDTSSLILGPREDYMHERNCVGTLLQKITNNKNLNFVHLFNFAHTHHEFQNRKADYRKKDAARYEALAARKLSNLHLYSTNTPFTSVLVSESSVVIGVKLEGGLFGMVYDPVLAQAFIDKIDTFITKVCGRPKSPDEIFQDLRKPNSDPIEIAV